MKIIHSELNFYPIGCISNITDFLYLRHKQSKTVAAEKAGKGDVVMKNGIGIIKRTDDLGRFVIPKEIRRTLRIREGDPLLIILDKMKKREFAMLRLGERLDLGT